MNRSTARKIFDPEAELGGLRNSPDSFKSPTGLTPAEVDEGCGSRGPARSRQLNLVASSSNQFFENLADGVTVQELARELRIAPKTIYDWIYRRRMPAWCILRINGRVRLNRKAVEAWLFAQQLETR